MGELILEKLKVLLSSYPSITLSDEVLTLWIEQELALGISYCNRDSLPDEAATTIAFMCLDMLINQFETSVNNVSEGGSSVSFGNLTVMELTNEHKKALDRYKQIRGR